MNVNPAVPGRLTRIAEGNLGGARVSGDGSTVVWSQWFGKDWEVMRHQGGAVQRLTKDPGQDSEADVSHDGSAVVFSRTVGKDPFDPDYHTDVVLWRDGRETVVAGTDADEFEPRISGDGHTVVYCRDHIRERTGFDIYRWQDGRTEAVTTGGPIDRRPLVDDRGERIFFTRLDKGKSDFWMRDEAGTVKPLTWREGGEYDPEASGDGLVVAWSQKENERDQFLYRYDTEGGNPVRIWAEKGEDATRPSLSGDGSALAFTRRIKKDEGSDLQVCLAEGDRVLPLNLDGKAFDPRISRDGRVITFLAVEPDQPGQVVLYRFDRE